MAKSLLVFGTWVIGESLAAWFIMWGDSLLVGKYLGVKDLGLYRTGWMVVTLVFGLFLSPFSTVLYPTFSRLQDDLPALRSTFHKANRVAIALALPIGTGLLLVGGDLTSACLGARWDGLGLVVGLVGLLQGAAWTVAINPEVYRAMGRPDINAKLMLVTIVYYLPVYLIAAPHGLEVFTGARLAVALLATPIHVYICCRMLRVSPFYLWRDGHCALLASLSMVVVAGAVRYALTAVLPHAPAMLQVFVLVAAGVASYVGSLALLDLGFVRQVVSLAKRTAAG